MIPEGQKRNPFSLKRWVPRLQLSLSTVVVSACLLNAEKQECSWF